MASRSHAEDLELGVSMEVIFRPCNASLAASPWAVVSRCHSSKDVDLDEHKLADADFEGEEMDSGDEDENDDDEDRNVSYANAAAASVTPCLDPAKVQAYLVHVVQILCQGTGVGIRRGDCSGIVQRVSLKST